MGTHHEYARQYSFWVHPSDSLRSFDSRYQHGVLTHSSQTVDDHMYPLSLDNLSVVSWEETIPIDESTSHMRRLVGGYSA